MTYQIAYGRDTESLEDPDQIVLLDLPEECSDMDGEELEHWINDNFHELRYQELVGITDVLESMELAMFAEGVTPEVRRRVLATVSDAITNNA